MYIYDDGGLIKVMPVSMSSVVFNYVFNILFFMYIYTCMPIYRYMYEKQFVQIIIYM